MSQRRKWWIGLAPLLALWLGVNKFAIGDVEADLARRADATLARVTGDPGLSATAVGRDVTIDGWIFEDSAGPAALDAVAELRGVRSVTDARRLPPLAKPWVWRAALADGVLTISGAAPSPDARAKLVAAAREILPRARVDDRSGYFSGAPAAFLAGAEGGLRVLAHLAAGEAQWRGDDLSLSGQAATQADYQAAVALAREARAVAAAIDPPKAAESKPAESKPAEPKPAAQAPPLEPPPPTDPEFDPRVCRDRLAALMQASPIHFEYNRAEIDPDSLAALDAAAAILRRCPAARFSVAGHWRNDRLALGRAENAIARLVAAGIDRGRLTAAAAGESRPDAPDDQRATDRHLEFKLR
jgi:OOP family OmpA-OmpF porin